MLLKKQTVWLLTMLSLVIVLSVYYVTSPDGGSNLAVIDNKETQQASEDVKEQASEETSDGDTVISSIASDDMFTALKLDLEDERSKLREQYEAVITSSNVSAEEKNEAIDKMEQLEQIAAKEAELEMLIKSQGYDDALVRVDGNQVQITVKAKKQSKEDANEIMRLVDSEIGSSQNVAVKFQISDK